MPDAKDSILCNFTYIKFPEIYRDGSRLVVDWAEIETMSDYKSFSLS